MFRNREIRQFSLVFLFIAAITGVLGFHINALAGILAVSSAAAFGLAFAFFTQSRYRAIAQISEQIDLVLHNAEHLYISEADEGELAVLQSQIVKMTMRIREQNTALKKEKEQLADSLADIAHQLRTPLTSLNLILTLLAQNGNESERRQLLWETEELLARMDWLITSLLKLSRLDAGVVVFQNDDIDVKQLIKISLQPLLIPMELHNVEVQMDVPQGVTIRGDMGWLSEAIRNILKNCMESAGENGRVEIFCKDTMLFTELTVHDSGNGFQAEELPCLFERFYRGKNSSVSGFGIGLALCRTIILGQNGTITAKNHPQGGAVFIIRFSK